MCSTPHSIKAFSQALRPASSLSPAITSRAFGFASCSALHTATRFQAFNACTAGLPVASDTDAAVAKPSQR